MRALPRSSRWFVVGQRAAGVEGAVRRAEQRPERGALRGRAVAPFDARHPVRRWRSRPRRIRFMGKAPLFRVPLLGWIFTRSRRLPGAARRHRPQAATRLDARSSRTASPSLVYPEGTRQHGPKIAPLQPGAAYLALKAGVPIVPVGHRRQRGDPSRSSRRPHPAVSVASWSWSASRSCRQPRVGPVVKRADVDALTATPARGGAAVFDEAYRSCRNTTGCLASSDARSRRRRWLAEASGEHGRRVDGAVVGERPPWPCGPGRVAAEHERGRARRARASARAARGAAGSTRLRR